MGGDNIALAFYRIDKEQDRTESETSKNDQESTKLKDELDFDTNVNSADSDEDSDVLEEQFKSMNFETAEIWKVVFMLEIICNQLW